MERVQQDNLQTRMQAVAKLKRAASLPRMKDGRRPPMHSEAVSDGERVTSCENKESNINPPEVAVDVPENAEMEPGIENAEAEQSTWPVAATRSKRRSRSRSRSRGSKDLKMKTRLIQCPTPPSQFNHDSSPDDTPPPPLLNLTGPPGLASPIPTPMLDRLRFLRSPTPSTSTPDPSICNLTILPQGTTILPSLEALQRGLFRSNSASGSHANRLMAMHKLTGGTETYDPFPLAGLNRNNTVTGGERLAARNNMFSRLGGRFTKETDGDIASGEDLVISSPTPKRRRRRSRSHPGSQNSNNGISESELTSTSNTPLAPSAPLPADSDLQNHSRSATPSYTARPSSQESGQPVIQFERQEPARRRSVVIEEDDDPSPPSISTQQLPTQAVSRCESHLPNLHIGGSHGEVSPLDPKFPAFSIQRTFQRSPPADHEGPFGASLTKVAQSVDLDSDDDRVLYGADTHQSRIPHQDTSDREVSWISTTVPERMPVNDKEDDDDDFEQDRLAVGRDEPPFSARSSVGLPWDESGFQDSSPRNSAHWDGSAQATGSSVVTFTPYPCTPPSPPFFSSISTLPVSEDSTSSPVFPTRLSVVARLPEFPEFEERGTSSDTPSKRSGDGPTTWEKVKNTFSGRRSRTNSLANRERREQVDSSTSRESGSSLATSRADKGEPNNTFLTQQPSQSLMQSPSASASILSLPYPSARNGPSPIPPASSADIGKYQDAKLFPFPGIKKLEEQRRAKGLPSGTASSPDIVMAGNSDGDLLLIPTNLASKSASRNVEVNKEHQLSHQISDSNIGKIKSPRPTATAYSLSAHPSLRLGGSSTPPTTFEGVKKKRQRSLFASRPFSPTAEVDFPPLSQDLVTMPIYSSMEQIDSGWEEIVLSPNETPDIFFNEITLERGFNRDISHPRNSTSTGIESPDMERTPKAKKLLPPSDHSDEAGDFSSSNDLSPHTALPRHDPFMSATPDPSSSLSDYPARSTSESSSTNSSRCSEPVVLQGHVILEKLNEDLTRGSLSRVCPLDDDSRRKLLLSSPVFQVVNSNTLKDRFLFLFNDLLIIAKPVITEQDSILDIYKANPLDRKYSVKSVVLLRQLYFHADRGDLEGTVSSRNLIMKSFIEQFSLDPDAAVHTIFSKPGRSYDPAALGQLLFRSLELDHIRCVEYLTRRSSRSVLRAYLDSFGFLGIKVDTALRAFLLSIHIPKKSLRSNSLELLLDAFASRWYEANASLVDYDKDCAHRLVRAIVQLNELLHEDTAQEDRPAGHPRCPVSSTEFMEAFRRHEPRCLVTDRLLEEVYHSILAEKLFHAHDPGSMANILITVKRAIPARLTWKVQSEPVIFRLPQVDPDFTIKLYGQDLVFEPPVLHFTKSTEAAFRITGLSLGSKSLILCRSGLNAVKYSGLPLSCPVVIERAFMRHTFQMAFKNHHGTKRRYMFSVDDALLRHQWVSSLTENIDHAHELWKSSASATSKFRQAAESLAFRVLQEELFRSPLRDIKHEANCFQDVIDSSVTTQQALQPVSFHSRSKSRSQFYHRYGVGKKEREGTNLPDDLCVVENGIKVEGKFQYDETLWSARDLELHCKQNSAVVSVLFTYLQDNGREKCL